MGEQLAYETDAWPFVPAKNFKDLPTGTRKVRVIVIHSMETPEGEQTAENVANWFKNQPANEGPSSAHVCIDVNSVVQSVRDSDIAYAAPGANHDGIQIELAGRARQTKKEWLDEYGVKLLDRAADVVAQYSLKFAIPALWLTDKQLRDGHRGIVGHDQVTRVYKQSTHTDPGPGFPWEYFICAVKARLELRQGR